MLRTWILRLAAVAVLGAGVLVAAGIPDRIVLALATIAKALGFQFWRLAEIVRAGR